MKDIIVEVPLIIYADRLLWILFTSLIYLEVVEWYQTDMVTRQFGFAQYISQALVNIRLIMIISFAVEQTKIRR